MTALHEEFAVPVDLPARNNKKRDLNSDFRVSGSVYYDPYSKQGTISLTFS